MRRSRITKLDLALKVAHVGAVAFDGWTTSRYEGKYYHEGDPLTRPFIGNEPTSGRMAAWGAVEVAGTALLARRWARMRWLQVGLGAAHAGAGAHNLTLKRHL